MKTARIVLKNRVNGREEYANAFFDTGAKRTYMTVEKAKKLGLNVGPEKVVRLNTFGTQVGSEMHVGGEKGDQ